MPKPPIAPDELPEPTDPSLDGGSPDTSYDLPPELDDDAPKRRRGGAAKGAPADAELETLDDAEFTAVSRPRAPALKVGIAVAAVLAIGGGLLWYRSAHRARTVRQALVEAETLMRLDTAAAYRAAADKLDAPAQMDPVAAGSARAFALAMLACDYRDAAADAAADELLVAPERAETVPDQAYLARAALALGKRAMGDASNAASRAQGRNVWADALQARIAMAADRLSAAVEPSAAAAADGAFAAGLAVQGDVARRARRDPAAARAAYTAALAAAGDLGASPRATFGLAKLALAGQMPPAEAMTGLERLLQDGRVPAPERGRAALHLAALRLRAGDGGGAQAALDLAGLDPDARAWAERAARVAAARRGVYRAPVDAPASLQSRTDDDPPEAEPPPPPPPPEPRPVARPAKALAKASAKAPAKASAKPAAKKAAAAHGGKSTAAKKAAKKKATER
ncbi:hypothetical protein [Anaeromyxobacter oryzae]|uniref:Tetratricopeptide repeat protein n=1 Tax=Anaeromyxobacter oryzae TaxID=2918170 RepID=A0ABN6MZG2_9BACT|nr:hypothetical protein [Anaeromyxobacter oryzae]BDG06342.1 hypothetical protein AMOR_53380 [Anaeromyxobacter oryzae]